MTTKRYYYTDPLAAAWMAKHHDMRFEVALNTVNSMLEIMPASMAFAHPAYLPNPYFLFQDVKKIYIHPDSLHLLKPQEGDIGWDELNDLCEMWESGWRKVCGMREERGYKPIMPIEIILRNGKAFMWPEVEDNVA